MHHELQGSSKASAIEVLNRLNRRSLTFPVVLRVWRWRVGEAMNVQAQVQVLFIEVIDAESICVLYHGRAPWSWL